MNQNPTFNLQLDLNETNAVLAALQELPGKVCNPITEKIKTQAQAQIASMQEAAAEAAAEEVIQETTE